MPHALVAPARPCRADGYERLYANAVMSGEILVVDDDFAIRECVAEVFTMEGFHVHEARNGREGLEALLNARPDLVVLDLMMPVMDGWQFLAVQRARPEVASVPVVVMTASGSEPPEAACVLHKPFEIDVLLGVVTRLVAPAANGLSEDAGRSSRELADEPGLSDQGPLGEAPAPGMY